MLKNIFDKTVTNEILNRIDKLTPSTQPLWGTMSVDKMLAHCNVSYEMAFENIHKKPNAIMKFILKLMVKNTVVNEVPYKKNSSTAPAFVIKDGKNFEAEKVRLKAYITKTQELGATHFEGKESHSFGALTSTEWNNMFYKHLDHHLRQFGEKLG
jgi:Protein of unknown function (DUF1569)